MTKFIDTPEFMNDTEEAEWWDANQDLLDAAFVQAAREGTLTRGTLTKRGLTPTTTIRLDPTDIELAKVQAEARGLRYQTYLKMILHRALMREAAEAARKATA